MAMAMVMQYGGGDYSDGDLVYDNKGNIVVMVMIMMVGIVVISDDGKSGDCRDGVRTVLMTMTTVIKLRTPKWRCQCS